MISAVLITLNEEKQVEQALRSLKGIANEIIVVDSGSNDRTLQICRDFGAKTYIRKFDNFAAQKNYALDKASGEWILALDADEEIPKALADEIKIAVNNGNFTAYLISRKNFILGKEIKYSRWSPDKHIWLWKKDKGRWVGDVHEEVVVEGKVGTLKNSKIHNSYQTLSEFMEANNKYSSLEAESLYKSGKKYSFSKMVSQATIEFFLRYFYKKGFLDGKKGFALAYMMAVYKLTVAIKLWELEKEK